jgi:hydrogenase maturation factor HypF (carbamoyltransferase family)
MKFSLKSVKTWNTHDGGGYQGQVLLDGKPALAFHNDGNGGGTDITAFSVDLMRKIEAHVKTLGPVPVEGTNETIENSVEMFISFLLDRHEEDKWLKRHCKQKTLFRITGDKENAYRIVKKPYDDKVKQYLTKTYGDQIIEIANERFL